MFNESAEFYDLIYSSFKNYADEAVLVAEWIERYRPGAQSVLDVACGTGEHARLLSARGYDVDGIDINSEFVEIARAKVPGGTFSTGDMSDFNLNRTYDVVLCLFSSIGYARTVERMRETVARLADHLSDDGLLLVEPWFTPEQWRTGHVHHQMVSKDDVHVARMGYSGGEGTISTIRFDYLVGREGQGVEHRTELHELGLFTRDEMTSAFTRAGIDVVYDETGIAGRGLYAGRHRRVC
jgi:SAM-dependent methyltransferase